MPSKATKSEQAETVELYGWDGGPTTRKPWYDKLADNLSSVNSKYRSLWQTGTTVNHRSGKIIVRSESHRFHHFRKNIKKHEMGDPFTLAKLLDGSALIAAM